MNRYNLKTKLTILNEYKMRVVHKYIGYVAQRKVHVLLQLQVIDNMTKVSLYDPMTLTAPSFYVT